MLQPTKSIGANGIAFDDAQGDLWIAVSDTGSILRVPVSSKGTAGVPAVVVQSAKLKTADGIAFDTKGGLYIAVNRTDELYVLTSAGALLRVANRSDGLSYPTQPAFGPTSETQRSSLFLTNGALYNGVANLIKFDVGVGGLLP